MRLALVLAGLGLAALAGCRGLEGVPVVGPTNTDRYTPSSNALFVGNGQLVLIGEVVPAETRLRLAQVAADGIADGAFGTPFRLVPAETAQIPSRNRVIVVIGGANQWELCTSQPERGGAFNGQGISISAAACNGDRRLSSTSGRIGKLEGVDDPALAYFFTQVGAELFPGRNIDYEPQDRGSSWDF